MYCADYLRRQLPIGVWPADSLERQIGIFCRHVLDDAEGFILFMTNVQGWSKEQVTVFLAHLRKDLQSGKYHSYYRLKIVWGRKPAS